VYTVDLLFKSIAEGTNDAGDLYQNKMQNEAETRDRFPSPAPMITNGLQISAVKAQ